MITQNSSISMCQQLDESVRYDTKAEEAKRLKEERHVNFKINSLLSKPFDEVALEEQTKRPTQTQPPGMKQTTLDDFQ